MSGRNPASSAVQRHIVSTTEICIPQLQAEVIKKDGMSRFNHRFSCRAACQPRKKFPVGFSQLHTGTASLLPAWASDSPVKIGKSYRHRFCPYSYHEVRSYGRIRMRLSFHHAHSNSQGHSPWRHELDFAKQSKGLLKGRALCIKVKIDKIYVINIYSL